MDTHDDFRLFRERKTMEIRFRNREQIIRKRRNITADIGYKNISTQIQQQSHPNYSENYSQIMEYQISTFDQLLGMLQSSDIKLLQRSIIRIRQIITKAEDHSLKRLFKSNTINRLIQLGYHSQHQLKIQSALILSILASSQSKYCQKLVQKGAIEFFIFLLEHSHQSIIQHAIWGIGNLAAEKPSYRDKILKYGGIQKIIKVYKNPQCKKFILNTIWALGILCRGSPPPRIKYIIESLPVLCQLIKSESLQKQLYLSDILWSIANITQWESNLILLHEEGALRTIFLLAKNENIQIFTPCLKIIGDYSKRNRDHIYLLIRYGILDLSAHLLQNAKISMRIQICWILSNILSEDDNTILPFLSHDQILNKIGQLFKTECKMIQKQICWIYANITQCSHNTKIVEVYLKYNVMQIFCSLLKDESLDIVLAVIQALQVICFSRPELKSPILRIFLSMGGAKCIESLLDHDNKNIYSLAQKIKDSYCQLENQMID